MVLRLLNKKRTIFFYAFILVLLLNPLVIVSSHSEYEIEGETVYIDDYNAYLSIYPHTSTGGWVYFNFTSKTYEGALDLLFGFDREVSYPTKVDYYDPKETNITKTYTIGNVYEEDPNYNSVYSFESQDNKFLYNGSVELYDFMDDEWILSFNHTFDRADKKSTSKKPIMIYWNETIQTSWTRITNDKHDWITINKKYREMTKWYYITLNVVENLEYKLRLWMEVLPSLDGEKSKYWVAMKPHSETLQESIQNRNFYALDPWYNNAWTYRKNHTITQASGSGTNYQILMKIMYGAGADSGNTMYCNSHPQVDFDDLRFTDDDGETLLDYWIENKTDSDFAWCWIEVKDDLSSTDRLIWIYYGNAGASSGTNGFDTFLYFDNFESANADWVDSDAGSGVSERNTDLPHQGSYSYEFYNPGVGSVAMRVNSEVDQAIDFRSVAHMRAIQTTDTFVQDWDDTGTNTIWYGFRSNGSIVWYQQGVDYMHIMEYVADTWYRFEITTDFDNDLYDIWIDSVKERDDAVMRSSQSSIDSLTINDYNAESGTEYFDTFFISKFVDPEPGHGSYGAEEELVVIPTAITNYSFTGLFMLINGSFKANGSVTVVTVSIPVNITVGYNNTDYLYLKTETNATIVSHEYTTLITPEGNTTVWSYSVLRSFIVGAGGGVDEGFVLSTNLLLLFIAIPIIAVLLIAFKLRR